MPKYTKKKAERKAQKLIKAYIDNDLNQSAVARELDVTQSAINQRMNKQPVKDCLAEFLNSDKLKKKLIKVGIEGLKATKTQSISTQVEADGELITKTEDKQVADHAGRHKYWHDLMVAGGGIRLDKSTQGISFIQINYGYRTETDKVIEND